MGITEQLRGQVVLVTGAGSGLGRALSEYAAGHGAIVVASDLDLDSAEQTIHRVLERGGSGLALRTDVGSEPEVQAMVQTAHETFGRVDMLINNAGIAINGEFQDISDQDWRRVMDVNFWGVIYGCRAAYPIMMAQGSGHLVNVSSLAGLMPGGLMSAYGASKHAVVGFSTNLRSEARQYGIKVTALCPGYLETPMHASATNVTDYVAEHDLEYRRRDRAWPTAEATVDHMMRGVLRDESVVVSPPAQVPFWWVYRVMPELYPWAWTQVIGRLKRRHAG